MTTSTTSEQDKPRLLVEDELITVSHFEKSTDKKTALRIVEVIDIDQIGTSYRVNIAGRRVPGEVDYFLKIPEPVEPRLRDHLRDRFTREMYRGKELNDLAETIKKITKKDDEFAFNLPKLIQAGLILKVGESTTHPACGLPYVLYDWIVGSQLDKLIARSGSRLRAKWFEFARGLAQVVGRLHNHGFLHAYIVPRNILISEERGRFHCALAGFGYSSLSIEESSSPQREVEDDAPFQAPEFSSRRPLDALWHPADIFSVGAVLLYLATGVKPPRPTQTASFEPWYPAKIEKLKRMVRERLIAAAKKKCPAPLKTVLQNDNVAKIIDNCLRYEPDDRIATAEELLEAIDIAATQPIKGHKSSDKSKGLGPFFSEVLKQRVKETEDFRERLMDRRHFELYGSRTKIIEGLCRMLGGLGRNAVYRTVSLPSYWTDKNLGPDGRFLAMNKHVARRGVIIERIFLVSGPYHTLSDEEQDILTSQQTAIKDLSDANHHTFQVKVHVVSRHIVEGFERSGKAVAFVAWQKEYLKGIASSPIGTGQFLCLNFISRGEIVQRYGKSVIEREIKKVRIWDPGRGKVYGEKLKIEVENFDEYWKQGSTLTLEQYIKEGSTLSLDNLLAKG